MIVATGMGGELGLSSGSPPEGRTLPLAAGVRGLVKTFARELPESEPRLVDLDPRASADVLAAQLLDELCREAAPIEIGRCGEAIYTPTLVHAPLETGADQLRLDASSVLVVTGGARGIGAKTCVALARAYGCSFELIGRSPLPDQDEAPEIAAALDAPALRRVLVSSGPPRRPAQIEAECARILAARGIRETLAQLEALGSQVVYHAVDVRDGAQLSQTLREIRTRRGRIDGVIHAAGVLEDKWIRDKTADSFRRVWDTKLAGLLAIAAELRAETQFIICFGSVSGAFGNRGQVDYAAANDALASVGRCLQSRTSGRVVTVDWGPWGGTGMVTPELEREYTRRGVGLIEPDDGVQCLIDELRFGDRESSEVVVMRAEPAAFSMPVSASLKSEPAATPYCAPSSGSRNGVGRTSPPVHRLAFDSEEGAHG